MNFKLAYDYDDFGLYAGFSKAWESPLEPGVYHLPKNSTLTAPPISIAGSVQQWNGASWASVTDNRCKTTYNVEDASVQTKIPASNVIPTGTVLTAPTCESDLLSCCSWDATSASWKVDSAKGSQVIYKKLYAAIDVKTDAILLAGFSYLGQTFICDGKGQADVTALYLESQDPTTSYPTQFYSGTSVWTVNSATDLLTFCRAVKAYISGAKAAALALRQQIAQETAESADQWLARLESWTDPR